ncbi:transmembrane protein, putative [Bodo saltans]|uniref:Transmembrane protein, putative n=1 Tax=Bodo saltans TaxID=75058 RepID=A0A0S4IMG4_BODSA|nr:transmembrane protein, putative [Bodo saltans]|eukprot:CUF44746.1 transmembrane protein, putative [Bodo saltans]
MYDPVTLLPAISSAAELANDTTYLLSSCNASSSSGGGAALWPPFLTCPGLVSHHAVLHNINIVFDGAQSSTSSSNNNNNEGPLLPCPIVLCSAADLFHVNIEISNCHWNLSLPIIESTSQQPPGVTLFPLWMASLYNATISYVNTTFTRDSALEVPPFAVVGAMEYVDFKIDLMSFRGFVGPFSLPPAASATSSPARNRNNNVEASIVGPLVNLINGSGVVAGVPGPTSAINVTFTVSNVLFLNGPSQVLYMEFWEIISLVVSIEQHPSTWGESPSLITLACSISATRLWCTRTYGVVALVARRVVNTTQTHRNLNVQTVGYPTADFALSYIVLQPKYPPWVPWYYPGEGTLDLSSSSSDGQTSAASATVAVYRMFFRAEDCNVSAVALAMCICGLRIDGLIDVPTSTVAVNATASHLRCNLSTFGFDLRNWRDVNVLSTQNTHLFNSYMAVVDHTSVRISCENGRSGAEPVAFGTSVLGTPLVLTVGVLFMKVVTRSTLVVTDSSLVTNMSGGIVYANMDANSMTSNWCFAMLVSIVEHLEASTIVAQSSAIDSFVRTVASTSQAFVFAMIITGASAMYLSGVVQDCTLLQRNVTLTLRNATAPGFFEPHTIIPPIGVRVVAVGALFSYTNQGFNLPGLDFVSGSYLSVNSTVFTNTHVTLTDLTVYHPTDVSANCKDMYEVSVGSNNGVRQLLRLSAVILQAEVLINCTVFVQGVSWSVLDPRNSDATDSSGSASSSCSGGRGGQYTFLATLGNSTMMNSSLVFSAAPQKQQHQLAYERSRMALSVVQTRSLLRIMRGSVIQVQNTTFLAALGADADDEVQQYCRPMLFPGTLAATIEFVAPTLSASLESKRPSSQPTTINDGVSSLFSSTSSANEMTDEFGATVVLDNVVAVGIQTILDVKAVAYYVETFPSSPTSFTRIFTQPAELDDRVVLQMITSCTVTMCPTAAASEFPLCPINSVSVEPSLFCASSSAAGGALQFATSSFNPAANKRHNDAMPPPSLGKLTLSASLESKRPSSQPTTINDGVSSLFSSTSSANEMTDEFGATVVLDNVVAVGIQTILDVKAVAYYVETFPSSPTSFTRIFTQPAELDDRVVLQMITSCTVTMCPTAAASEFPLCPINSVSVEPSLFCASSSAAGGALQFATSSFESTGVERYVDGPRSPCAHNVKPTLLLRGINYSSSPLATTSTQCSAKNVVAFQDGWLCTAITHTSSSSQSRRPAPPTRPPTSATTTHATAIAGQVGVAVVGSIATILASAGAFHSQRAMLGLRLASACGKPNSKNITDDEDSSDGTSSFLSQVPLSFADSPTQWEIVWGGASSSDSTSSSAAVVTTLPFQRGTIAGNLLVFAGIGILTSAVGIVSSACVQRSSAGGGGGGSQRGVAAENNNNDSIVSAGMATTSPAAAKSTLRRLLRKAMTAFGLPGTLMAPYMVLLQPTVAAAVTLMAASTMRIGGGSASPTTSTEIDVQDVVFGAFGLLMSILPMLHLMWRLAPREHFGVFVASQTLLWERTLEFRRREQQQQRGQGSCFASLKHLLAKLTHREVAWFARRKQTSSSPSAWWQVYSGHQHSIVDLLFCVAAVTAATLDHYEAVFAEYRGEQAAPLIGEHDAEGTIQHLSTHHHHYSATLSATMSTRNSFLNFVAISPRHFYILEALIAIVCGVISALGDLSGAAWCDELLLTVFFLSLVFFAYSWWVRPYASHILALNLHANNFLALLVAMFALMGTDDVIGGPWSTDAANAVALLQLALLLVVTLLDSNATLGELLRTGRCNRSRRSRHRQETKAVANRSQEERGVLQKPMMRLRRGAGFTIDTDEGGDNEMSLSSTGAARLDNEFSGSHIVPFHQLSDVHQTNAMKRLGVLVQMACKLRRRERRASGAGAEATRKRSDAVAQWLTREKKFTIEERKERKKLSEKLRPPPPARIV